MAGHSKWANIKFRKAAQDVKRGKLFTKLIREITIAAKQYGGDTSSNPRLRGAVDKALASNVTRDVIDRAIKRGVGGEEGSDLQEVRYEGYGPGGVALLVDCLTDNRNRTVSEVRHAFSRNGGNLGTAGSVSYMFKKIGRIVVSEINEDVLLEKMLDLGVDDITPLEDSCFNVLVGFEDFEVTKNTIERLGKIDYAEIEMIADNMVTVEEDIQVQLADLIDSLQDLDDVQEVYNNANFTME